MTRERLEAKDNWRATFECTQKPGRFTCLMGTIYPVIYYWHDVDYDGMFASGATRPASLSFLADAVSRGYLKLVSGVLPDLAKTAVRP